MGGSMLIPGLALLLGVAVSAIPLAAAQAQAAPRWPALRGVTELKTLFSFLGHPETMAACGITPDAQAAAFDLLRLVPEGAGMRIMTRQFERTQVSATGVMLVGAPRNVAITTNIVGLVSVLVATPPGGTPICSLAVDMEVRSAATGWRITATGLAFDGPVQIWHAEEHRLAAPSDAPAGLRATVEEGMRDLVAAWQAANGPPPAAAPPPPTAAPPVTSPPAGNPRR